MPNQYVIYWKPENLNNLGTKMKKASSNYFKKLSVGDTVYFVTQDVEGFVLMGKIVAETVTDSREKVAESLGCKVDDLNFYEEPEWHIVANPKTAFPMKALPAEILLEQLMVKSDGKVQRIKTPLSHHSFRSPRLLTTGSVRWLDEYVETGELPEAAVRASEVQEKRIEEDKEVEAAQRGWFSKFRDLVGSVLRSERRERRRFEEDSSSAGPRYRRRSRR